MIATWVVLVPFAAAMASAIAYLIRWAADARTALPASTVVFFLLMMVSMVAGAAVYYSDPGTPALVEGFWVASALRAASVVQVFVGFLVEARQRASGATGAPPPILKHRGAFVASIVLLVLVNELLMGWTFSAAAGSAVGFGNGSLPGIVSGFASTISSPWFLFTMAAEMFLSVLLLRDRLARPVVAILGGQALIMAFSPPALAGALWADTAIAVSSAAMIVLVVFVMEFLYRHRNVAPGLASYLVQLLAVYAGMMAGLYAWKETGSTAVFALAVVLEMVIFFGVLTRPTHFTDGPRTPWTLRPGWSVALLGTIFVAEVFMGALLDVAIAGPSFYGSVGLLPLSGGGGVVAYRALYDVFWFVALTTGSTWFLAMMGAEMGALVYFKFRETRSRETRVRLVLMMGSYAAFAVFFPSLYYPLVFPTLPRGAAVPVLGWSMGIGSAPLATSVFVVLLVTYAAVGLLAVLFGRRVVCSVFCTAPLMFQGTTVDAMKSFNRTSPLARKYLSSRFSAAYSITTACVMVSLVLASGASYLDQSGVWDLKVLGADPTVFLYALYFGVLWYVLFVTIPYSGTYNCVTMGWCYTGQVTAAFGRLGFFRLKVRDKEVCRRCTTVDCAKSCPVGLVDMPGHFRQKGEFRSSKCCGVGDCVEACPYGNMYFFDVRHWLREKLGRPARPTASSPLRMFPSRSHASPSKDRPASPGTGTAGGPSRRPL